MEADLRREYGARLRHLYTGELTWRELSSLVRGLSPQSATRTALNHGRPEPTGEQVLLADLFDITQHLDWHVQAANVAKRSDLPKKPKPYPRWWDTTPRRTNSSQRVARIEDARRRAAARRQAISEGRIA
ncbi:hypothetical protein [Streptomyces syringium]|uniref:hypothetical protein n=1 Tax=Streptomyces syringium TaxID=76729 RepID=UPI00345697EA